MNLVGESLSFCAGRGDSRPIGKPHRKNKRSEALAMRMRPNENKMSGDERESALGAEKEK
jgi:hypothetical protein